MEGKAEGDCAQAHHRQADQDHFPAADPVEDGTQEGLGQSVHQEADGCSQRDGATAPAEVLAHGDDEDAKAATGADRNEGDEHGHGDNVPAVIQLGLWEPSGSGLAHWSNPSTGWCTHASKFSPSAPSHPRRRWCRPADRRPSPPIARSHRDSCSRTARQQAHQRHRVQGLAPGCW